MNSNGASTSNSGDNAAKKDSKRPKYSKFTQQELAACKPLLTPGWVIGIFLAIGFVFIPIGVAALFASRNVVELVKQYETSCLPANVLTKDQKLDHIRNADTNKSCAVKVPVTKKMNSPVYVYYQLDNYYQNHRRYVKSRSDTQLRGTDMGDVTNCKPEDYYNGKIIVPCGLIAWSFFNDTYGFAIQGQAVPVNEEGISWRSDRDAKFSSSVLPTNFRNNNRTDPSNFIGGGALDETVPLNKQEHLIVWMRTAALPTFRKLWGKIEQDLEEGTSIDVTIQNQYNTYSFNGHKKLVLSTTSWLGGKNDFLGIAYLAVGCISVLFAAVFFIAHLRNPRQLGDTSYLSWNRNNPVTSSTVAD
eukprot:TRINITY_DN5425_c0_g1_i2.p1 TRINITY_DN5425_c0_g1~~TRINITY_DN5425_c0_g1_i2.p1  ORF type:complete len:359 (+),score=61.35 TRINITY_DN5425_c0_g1_i2:232-1308(+)